VTRSLRAPDPRGCHQGERERQHGSGERAQIGDDPEDEALHEGGDRDARTEQNDRDRRPRRAPPDADPRDDPRKRLQEEADEERAGCSDDQPRDPERPVEPVAQERDGDERACRRAIQAVLR
jgi:hypothetical protein